MKILDESGLFDVEVTKGGDADMGWSCYRNKRKQSGGEVKGRCTLGNPIWMVIPSGGTYINCPVHGQHFLPGNTIQC